MKILAAEPVEAYICLILRCRFDKCYAEHVEVLNDQNHFQ